MSGRKAKMLWQRASSQSPCGVRMLIECHHRNPRGLAPGSSQERVLVFRGVFFCLCSHIYFPPSLEFPHHVVCVRCMSSTCCLSCFFNMANFPCVWNYRRRKREGKNCEKRRWMYFHLPFLNGLRVNDYLRLCMIRYGCLDTACSQLPLQSVRLSISW